MSRSRILSSVANRYAARIKQAGAGHSPYNYAWPVSKDTLGMASPAAAQVGEADDTSLSIPFLITELREDRDGDVVVPTGCRLHNYKYNPVVFFGHESFGMPIGVSRDEAGNLAVYPEEKRVIAKCFFDKHDEDAMFVHGKVKRGILTAASVAFVPIEATPRKASYRKAAPRPHGHEDDPTPEPGWVYEIWDMTEWSIVGVPANAGAVRDMLDREKAFISKGLQRALIPYAAVAKGCFRGYCPCPPIEKGEFTGKPCKPGLSAARTGCIPASGKPGGAKPASGGSGTKPKPAGGKKPSGPTTPEGYTADAGTLLKNKIEDISKGGKVKSADLKALAPHLESVKSDDLKSALKGLGEKVSGTKAVMAARIASALAKHELQEAPPKDVPKTPQEVEQKLTDAKQKIGFSDPPSLGIPDDDKPGRSWTGFVGRALFEVARASALTFAAVSFPLSTPVVALALYPDKAWVVLGAMGHAAGSVLEDMGKSAKRTVRKQLEGSDSDPTPDELRSVLEERLGEVSDDPRQSEMIQSLLDDPDALIAFHDMMTDLENQDIQVPPDQTKSMKKKSCGCNDCKKSKPCPCDGRKKAMATNSGSDGGYLDFEDDDEEKEKAMEEETPLEEEAGEVSEDVPEEESVEEVPTEEVTSEEETVAGDEHPAEEVSTDEEATQEITNAEDHAGEAVEAVQAGDYPLGAQILANLIDHAQSAMTYLEETVGAPDAQISKLEHEHVRKYVHGVMAEMQKMVEGLNEAAGKYYPGFELEKALTPPEQQTTPEITKDEDLGDKSADELLEEYRKVPGAPEKKHKPVVIKAKSIRKATVRKACGVMKDTAEFLDDVAGDEGIAKRYKAGFKYHAKALSDSSAEMSGESGGGTRDKPDSEVSKKKPAPVKKSKAQVEEEEVLKQLERRLNGFSTDLFKATGIRSN